MAPQMADVDPLIWGSGDKLTKTSLQIRKKENSQEPTDPLRQFFLFHTCKITALRFINCLPHTYNNGFHTEIVEPECPSSTGR